MTSLITHDELVEILPDLIADSLRVQRARPAPRSSAVTKATGRVVSATESSAEVQLDEDEPGDLAIVQLASGVTVGDRVVVLLAGNSGTIIGTGGGGSAGLLTIGGYPISTTPPLMSEGLAFDGVTWRPLPRFPTLEEFGAVADGVKDPTTRRWSGTDNTVALQAALDSNQVVYGKGAYRITAPLIAKPTLNRGNGFASLTASSLYPATTLGSGPAWTGAGEFTVGYDGPVDDWVSVIRCASVEVGVQPPALGADDTLRGFTLDNVTIDASDRAGYCLYGVRLDSPKFSRSNFVGATVDAVMINGTYAGAIVDCATLYCSGRGFALGEGGYRFGWDVGNYYTNNAWQLVGLHTLFCGFDGLFREDDSSDRWMRTTDAAITYTAGSTTISFTGTALTDRDVGATIQHYYDFRPDYAGQFVNRIWTNSSITVPSVYLAGEVKVNGPIFDMTTMWVAQTDTLGNNNSAALNALVGTSVRLSLNSAPTTYFTVLITAVSNLVVGAGTYKVFTISLGSQTSNNPFPADGTAITMTPTPGDVPPTIVSVDSGLGTAVVSKAPTTTRSSVVSCTLSQAAAPAGWSNITQLTSKSTGVTLNQNAGRITMHAQSLASGATATFTLTNSHIGVALPPVFAIHASGGTAGAYTVHVDSISAGSAVISVTNESAGALAQAIVLAFTVRSWVKYQPQRAGCGLFYAPEHGMYADRVTSESNFGYDIVIAPTSWGNGLPNLYTERGTAWNDSTLLGGYSALARGCASQSWDVCFIGSHDAYNFTLGPGFVANAVRVTGSEPTNAGEPLVLKGIADATRVKSDWDSYRIDDSEQRIDIVGSPPLGPLQQRGAGTAIVPRTYTIASTAGIADATVPLLSGFMRLDCSENVTLLSPTPIGVTGISDGQRLLVHNVSPTFTISIGNTTDLRLAGVSPRVLGLNEFAEFVAYNTTWWESDRIRMNHIVPAAARGDLLWRGITNWGSLPIGAAGLGLVSDGTDLGWGTVGIVGGGTGAATQAAAILALMPTALRGGIPMKGTANWGVLAATADPTFVLGSDGTDAVWKQGPKSGSWTPTFRGATVAGTWSSYVAQTGIYVRVGNLVYVACRVRLTGTATDATGNLTIAGLPYAAFDASNGIAVGRYLNTNTVASGALEVYSVGAFVAAGDTKITLVKRSSIARSDTPFDSAVDLGASAGGALEVNCSGVYYTTDAF